MRLGRNGPTPGSPEVMVDAAAAGVEALAVCATAAWADADRFEVVGRTSTERAPDNNQELSLRRAHALAERGFSVDAESVINGDALLHVDPDNTEADRTPNRRVEIRARWVTDVCLTDIETRTP